MVIKVNLLNEEYSQDGQLQKRSSYFAGLRFIDDLINKNDSVFQFPLADQHNHPATVSFSQGQSKNRKLPSNGLWAVRTS